MKHKHLDRHPAGFSLLELMVTVAMMATLATAVAVVLRGAQNAWEAHDSDHARLQAAHATLRHVTRQLRQCRGVVAISDPTDLSGTLSALMPNGDTVVWEHVPDQVNYGVTSASSMLAEQVEELSFAGYKADGVTPTTTAPEIRSIVCSVTVTLPNQGSAQRTVSTRIWLRAW